MKLKNLEEYINFVNGLPPKLQEIYLNYYDEDGRPYVENPKKHIILSLINLHKDSSIENFVEDVKKIYPEMDSNDISIYYDVFIAGILTLSNNLIQ